MRRVFSLRVVLAALLLLAVLGCVRSNLVDPEYRKAYSRLVRPVFTPDTWWQLLAGEEILQTGSVPRVDSYSFTVAGHEWVAYQWLGEVLMALTHHLGGLQGLVALTLVLSAVLMFLLYYLAWQRCGNVFAAFLACVLVMPLLVVSFTLRPQVLGYAFFLITLICLERFRRGEARALWLLPPVFLLWVNIHGTFLFGLLVLGLYWVSGLVEFRCGFLTAQRWSLRQRRHLLVVILLSIVALTLTPYGTRLAAYPLELSLLQPLNVGLISEWQPVPLDVWWGKWAGLLLLLFLFGQVIFPLSWRVEEMALLLGAGYAGFVHQRMIVVLALVLAPFLAVALAPPVAGLARWTRNYRPAREYLALNVGVLVLIAALTVVFLPSRQEIDQAIAGHYPRGAVEYLRRHPVEAPMLNVLHWGGYLTWELGPEHKVFIDSRIDIYEYAGVFTDYLDIVEARPRALFLLEKYGVEACLLHRWYPLATFLAAQPDWRSVYADEMSVLYVHESKRLMSVSAVAGANANSPSLGPNPAPITKPDREAIWQ
ncbi:MAG TPA: hypothetical protein VJ085_07550 [Candidatus Acidoferrales bacterium]|nr:hypothetical protein [Candidatus Acidoferrales bacterium]